MIWLLASLAMFPGPLTDLAASSSSKRSGSCPSSSTAGWTLLQGILGLSWQPSSYWHRRHPPHGGSRTWPALWVHLLGTSPPPSWCSHCCRRPSHSTLLCSSWQPHSMLGGACVGEDDLGFLRTGVRNFWMLIRPVPRPRLNWILLIEIFRTQLFDGTHVGDMWQASTAVPVSAVHSQTGLIRAAESSPVVFLPVMLWPRESWCYNVNTDVETESMLWLGIAASNSLTRKTTGLAPVTSCKLHRPKIINNSDMVVNKNMSTSHSADLLRPES